MRKKYTTNKKLEHFNKKKKKIFGALDQNIHVYSPQHINWDAAAAAATVL